MNLGIFRMSPNEMGIALLVGAGCGIIFMYLLWETVRILPRVKHKYLFIFASKVLRIFLLLAVMILFSEKHAGRFLMIFCGFVIMRLFILRFASFRVYHSTEEKQMQAALSRKRKKRR